MVQRRTQGESAVALARAGRRGKGFYSRKMSGGKFPHACVNDRVTVWLVRWLAMCGGGEPMAGAWAAGRRVRALRGTDQRLRMRQRTVIMALRTDWQSLRASVCVYRRTAAGRRGARRRHARGCILDATAIQTRLVRLCFVHFSATKVLLGVNTKVGDLVTLYNICKGS
jgi:hypothetical protein